MTVSALRSIDGSKGVTFHTFSPRGPLCTSAGEMLHVIIMFPFRICANIRDRIFFIKAVNLYI